MISYIGAILLLLILLLLTLCVFLYLSGLFEPIHVSCKAPPYLHDSNWFAYKIHRGPYNETGYLFTEAYSINSKCVQCGIRYKKSDDNAVGDGVQSENEETRETNPPHCAVGSFVDETTMDDFKEHDYQLTRLPSVDEAVVASFPHTSFLSIPIGSLRANYAMRAYIQEHELEVTTFLELYGDGKIHYVGLYKDTEPFNLPPTTEKDHPTDVGISVIQTIESVENIPTICNPDDESSGSELDELEMSFEKITEVPPVS